VPSNCHHRVLVWRGENTNELALVGKGEDLDATRSSWLFTSPQFEFLYQVYLQREFTGMPGYILYTLWFRLSSLSIVNAGVLVHCHSRMTRY
jgi:hypothetical protein